MKWLIPPAIFVLFPVVAVLGALGFCALAGIPFLPEYRCHAAQAGLGFALFSQILAVPIVAEM